MKSTRPEVATAHSSMHRIDVHKLADEARIRAVELYIKLGKRVRATIRIDRVALQRQMLYPGPRVVITVHRRLAGHLEEGQVAAPAPASRKTCM